MNNIDVSSEFLAVVLYQHDAPRVMKLTAAEAVAPSIRLGEADYLDSGAGDWLGFYDWLRNHQGEVIGVQQWVDETSINVDAKNSGAFWAIYRCCQMAVRQPYSRVVHCGAPTALPCACGSGQIGMTERPPQKGWIPSARLVAVYI